MNVYHINALAGMRLFLADASVDAIVTDPPYELGFMGKGWDSTGIAYSVELWREALRVLKPGGHLLAFSGSRTYHRMACAIEDAGFEIRDQIMWVYASGMPKSFNLAREVGKSICGCATGTLPYTHENTEPQTECHVRPVRNTDVPPAESPSEERREILQPGVPQQGAPMHGAEPREGRHGGGESGLAGRRDAVQAQGELQGHPVHSGVGVAAPDGAERRLHNGAPGRDGGMVRLPADPNGGSAPRRPRSDEQPARQSGTVADEQLAQAAGAWPLCPGCGLPVVPEGLGTALKPAHEPICVARKPIVGTVAANVLAHGTGALNIDGCRVDAERQTGWSGGGSKLYEGGLSRDGGDARPVEGRWPANLIHDGSDDVLAAFPSAPGQQGALTGDEPSARAGAVDQNCYGTMDRRHAAVPRREEDRSAARFFMTCKSVYNDDLWQNLNLPSENAITAEPSLRQQRQAAVSALALVASSALPVGLSAAVSLSALPTTSATPSELKRISEAVTQTIQSFDSAFWHAPQPAKLSLSRNHVSIAADLAPTGITTITVSRWKLDGSAEPVTLNITLTNSGAGAKGCAPSTANRFIYCAKASKSDRGPGNDHPTVKPSALMQYLVRLVTPPGGHVLDPFNGSGTTAIACQREGFSYTGFDLDPHYIEITRARLAAG